MLLDDLRKGIANGSDGGPAAAPPPTKSRQAAEKERAQVAGDDSATFARKSGVILFCFDDCLPYLTFCNSDSASLRRFRAHFNWFLSLPTL